MTVKLRVIEGTRRVLPLEVTGADDLGRLAQFDPDLELVGRLGEADCAVVEGLAVVPAAHRAKLWLLATRLAQSRELTALYQERQPLHGSVANGALNIGWWRSCGEKTFVAVRANRFGFIYRAERWAQRGQTWRCAAAWEYAKPLSIAESYPADAPIMTILEQAGYLVYPAVVQRNVRAWAAAQITTADHLLHSLGKKAPGIFHIWQLERLLRQPMVERDATDQAKISDRAKTIAWWLSRGFIAFAIGKLILHLMLH